MNNEYVNLFCLKRWVLLVYRITRNANKAEIEMEAYGPLRLYRGDDYLIGVFSTKTKMSLVLKHIYLFSFVFIELLLSREILLHVYRC